MSQRTFAIGIVGAGIVAQQLGESLIERAFPFSSLRFLGDENNVGEGVEIGQQVFAVDRFDERARDLDLVFLTREAVWNERDVEAMVLAGASIVDLSGRYTREVDVPLVVPECNAEALGEARSRQIVASPDSVAVGLSVVLAPLHAQGGLRRVVATCLEPVSEVGGSGIEELSRQTIDLLQGRGTEPGVFPARICFNVIPNLGEITPSGDSLSEEQTAWQLRRILGLPELAITVSRICVPTFYGTGISLNVELETPMDQPEATELLRAAPGILTTTAEEEVDLSVGDAVGQDATVVSRVRTDRSTDNGLNFWVAFDNSRKGSAVNAVQIAELMLRER